MAKTKTFTYQEFREILLETTDRKTISAVIVIAMAHWKEKKINDFAFANILRDASEQIEKNS